MAGTIRGRGAASNPPGRFDRTVTESVDDGWYREETAQSVATTLEPDRARTIITTNDSPDVPFDCSINPYRGCEHGCIYCYARPSHSYMGLSPGLDFESRLFYKPDAALLLEQELARPGYVCKPIMLGANTDAYQPIERELRITRSILEVLARCRHPVSVVTKSALIVRDVDLLADLARDRLALVMISLTTLDPETKRTLEPRAAAPQARLRAIRALTEAGVPVGVMVAPLIPGINDHELEKLLEAAVDAGACCAAYVVLRLPYEVAPLFREWLDNHHPQRARHVMALIRSLRGGRDNDPRFGTRMRGVGPIAEVLHRRFELACRRLGIAGTRRMDLDTTRFRPPERPGAQLELTF
ncbi:MAG: PA0069 family radical SAM protein [Pseudomonadota bacterium]|jgi:DNA repair photolyase|nr:MAG: radical SAM protein [Pseudomonadota bacterium]